MARARATMMLGGSLIDRLIQRHGVARRLRHPKFQFRASNRWIAATHSESTFDGFVGAKHPQQEAQMLRVELDTVIARPIDDVFGRLIDLSGYSRWMPKLGVFIRSSQTSEGPVRVGTTYYDTGWMGTFVGEIVEYHAPTRVAFKEKLRWLGVTVMEARPEYELIPTQTGTEVHHTAAGQLFGIFNVMQPVVAWMARGERRRTVRALKYSLERASLFSPVS